MILLLGTNQPWSAASNLQDSRWEGDAPSSLLRETEQQGFSRQPEEPLRMGHQHWQKQVGLQCSCPWLPWLILDREADRLDFFCSEDQILGYNHYRCSEIPKSRERSRLVGCFFRDCWVRIACELSSVWEALKASKKKVSVLFSAARLGYLVCPMKHYWNSNYNNIGNATYFSWNPNIT